MSPLAVGTTVSVLAVIGLVIGLVVLGVVIFLLNGVLAPLRAILRDLQSAKAAPMLQRGVPGTEQLSTTRRLAESVPDLALAYLSKLSLPAAGAAAAPPPPPPPPPPRAGPPADAEDSALPAWKRYRG
jgi:hypothetical protein